MSSRSLTLDLYGPKFNLQNTILYCIAPQIYTQTKHTFILTHKFNALPSNTRTLLTTVCQSVLHKLPDMFWDILDTRQPIVLLNNMIINKTVYKTIFIINTISLQYFKDEVSNCSVTIYHCTATLFSYTFLLGLMMTRDEMKHVTILQKQG
jgi:hypothetical protein